VAGQVRNRQSEALDEFDVWMQAHPQASPAEVRDFYRDLADRAQALTLGDGELSLVAPRSLGGSRDAITLDSLTAAEKRVIADLDAGRLSKTEADLELQRIGDWRRARLGQQAAKPAKAAK
jgi:hypothetical protein